MTIAVKTVPYIRENIYRVKPDVKKSMYHWILPP